MHYTEKFLSAWAPIEKQLQQDGPTEEVRKNFREAMLKLGHAERVKNLYRIQEKLTRKAAFFRANAPQENYLRKLAKRNINLKCRQVGFTTLNCLRGLDYALWEANSRAGILCHLQGTVETIFNDITKFSYNWFKKDWSYLYSPVEKTASTTAITFSEDGLGRSLESSIRVMFDFRGKTLSFMHVSEASRIDNARLVGSLQGVPVNGEVTLESTANGRGGDFYRLWDLHKKAGDLAPYKGFFIPWFDFYPEMPEDWNLQPDGFELTSYEKELLADPRIKMHHVYWRRWCIEANCEGSSETFENEYPTNDIDCFLSGEASVFSSTVLKKQERSCKPPFEVGLLMTEGTQVKFFDDVKGYVSIWNEPEVDRTYVIGADPSGGVGKDLGAAYVKDQKSGKLVARLWADLQPSDFAKELYKLALYYNRAWVCVEANNHGGTVLYVLKEIGYPNLYKRATIDEMTMKPTKKVGYLTTQATKLMLTENFKTSAKEGKIIIQDSELISEMSSFMQFSGKTGKSIKREASSGAHDDLVMAAALTEEMDRNRKVSDPDSETSYSDQVGDLQVDQETGFYG
jgi:hypothetical protein